MKKIFDVLNVIKQKLFVKKDKIHSEKYYRRIDFLNKYSLLFHAIIAMAIVFIVEIISRRSFMRRWISSRWSSCPGLSNTAAIA